MSLNQVNAALDDALAAFAAIQDEQRRAFEVGALGDLAGWRERRERAFGQLQFYLGRLLSAQPGRLDDQRLTGLRDRIGSLLAGEENLHQAADRQRRIIETRLSSMRKGKKALSGYGPGHGSTRSARFLSSRT